MKSGLSRHIKLSHKCVQKELIQPICACGKGPFKNILVSDARHLRTVKENYLAQTKLKPAPQGCTSETGEEGKTQRRHTFS